MRRRWSRILGAKGGMDTEGTDKKYDRLISIIVSSIVLLSVFIGGNQFLILLSDGLFLD